MIKHTPTPWESSELRAFTIQGPDGGYIAQMFYGSKGENKVLAGENERFIVLAVNSHEELLNYVKKSHALYLGKAHESLIARKGYCQTCEIIAKAEGK